MYGTIFGGRRSKSVKDIPHDSIESPVQPWFADGLDAEERAFISALDLAPRDDDKLFDRLLRLGTTLRIGDGFSLRWADPIRLWAFQDEPFASGGGLRAGQSGGSPPWL